MIELALIAIGLFAGAMAAALGIGGGVVFVPALVVLLDFAQQTAQGTSLAVILPTALVATVTHAGRGRVVWRIALPVSLAAVVGAVVGARIALALDGLLLRRMFAGLLAVLTVRMLIRSYRGSRGVDGNVDPPGGEKGPPRGG
jgi:uncharacterized membrane protein YfcA